MTMVPMYLLELCPSNKSGVFGVMFTIGLNFGCVLSQFLGMENILGWSKLNCCSIIILTIKQCCTNFITPIGAIRRGLASLILSIVALVFQIYFCILKLIFWTVLKILISLIKSTIKCIVNDNR